MLLRGCRRAEEAAGWDKRAPVVIAWGARVCERKHAWGLLTLETAIAKSKVATGATSERQPFFRAKQTFNGTRLSVGARTGAERRSSRAAYNNDSKALWCTGADGGRPQADIATEDESEQPQKAMAPNTSQAFGATEPKPTGRNCPNRA